MTSVVPDWRPGKKFFIFGSEIGSRARLQTPSPLVISAPFFRNVTSVPSPADIGPNPPLQASQTSFLGRFKNAKTPANTALGRLSAKNPPLPVGGEISRALASPSASPGDTRHHHSRRGEAAARTRDFRL